MRIISYNVNGIRSAIFKGLLDWLRTDVADVICFQELKASLPDIDTASFEALGFYCYWYPAQKKGYSGVGIISKIKPDKVEYGCGLKQADEEGRVIQAWFKDVQLINTYFPSGSSGNERQTYKMQFLDEYLKWLSLECNPQNKKVILAGDYNICHKAIDIHDPVSNKNSSGFLPEERMWFDTFFDHGFVDTFRMINPHPHQYSWWSFRANARNNNKGWRIDYINASERLRNSVTDAAILPDVKHSDHCPVFTSFKF